MHISPKDTLLLATRNPGKIRELAPLLTPFGLRVLGLDHFPNLPETEETGQSFLENALLKASLACSGTGLIAMADDSGLEVEALGGQPGIHSARFSLLGNPAAGQDALGQDDRNNAKLLALMKKIPQEKRQARYVCVIAAVAPNGARASAQGQWEGYILAEPRGNNGFGYDPLFFDPELARSAAELSAEEKNARSHRALALRRLLAIWPDFLGRASR